jgi:hypothetical protein
MSGKELARRLKDLDEVELLAFAGELSKSPELLENISDMVDVLLRRNEPSRDYGEFAAELREDGLL